MTIYPPVSALANHSSILLPCSQLILPQKQKIQLKAQLEASNKSRDAIRASLREMKSSLKFTTVDAIDDAIAKLEYRLEHNSLSLNEEKKVLEDIKKLRQSRGSIGTYTQKLDQLEQDDSSRGSMVGSIKAFDDQLNTIKKEEDKLREKLTSIRAKEANEGSDIGSLISERDQCREVCKQAYEKIKEMRAEHDKEWTTFKETDAAWRVQQAEDRKSRNEERVAEKAARDAERAARYAEMAPEPYDKEVTVCEQLTAYLSKFASSSTGPIKAEKKSVVPLEGMKPFEKKKENEEDSWMLGKATGGGGSKKKNGGKGAGCAGTGSTSEQKLTHSLDIIEAFSLLKLELPTTASKAAPLLVVVGDKKEHFLKLRAEQKEREANGETTVGVEKEEEGGDAGESSSAANGAAAAVVEEGGSKKGKRKSAKTAAALELDNVKNWPSVGDSVGGGADEEEEEEEGEVAKEISSSDDAAAPGALTEPKEEGCVVVALTVDASDSVKLAITA